LSVTRPSRYRRLGQNVAWFGYATDHQALVECDWPKADSRQPRALD
jgi:hypothetical protein